MANGYVRIHEIKEEEQSKIHELGDWPHRERENLEREEVFPLLCKGGFWGDLRVFFKGV